MQRRTGRHQLAAVLFTDIVGSTSIAAEMGNTRWSELIARHHRVVRRTLARFDGREVDTAGDGFFVTFERPAEAIRCAVAVTEAVRELGIEVRAGVGFGELETAGRKPSGLTVNTAARVMAVAGPGEVLVPAAVKDLVPGGGIAFADHGVHQLKGLDGEFRLFKVTEVDGAAPPPPLDVEEASERRREIFPTPRRRGPPRGGGPPPGGPAGGGGPPPAGALALTIAGILLFRGLSDAPETRSTSSGPLRQSVVLLDGETGEVGSSIFLGARGGYELTHRFIQDPLAAGEGGVWVLRPPFLVHVDPDHAEVRTEPIHVALGTSQTVATGFDAVWVLTDATLLRIHPATDERQIFVQLPGLDAITTYALAVGDALYLGVSDGTLVRVDPRTGAQVQALLDASADVLAASREAVWVGDVIDGTVQRHDPASLGPVGERIEVDGSLDLLAATASDLWILDQLVGVVTRVTANSGKSRGSARVGDEPTDMAVGFGSVWVGDMGGSVWRIDESTLEVEEIPVGAEVLGVAIDGERRGVWLYLGEPVTDAAA